MRAHRDPRLPSAGRLVRDVADSLAVSRTEAVGVLALLVSATAATALLWWTATPRSPPMSVTPPSPVPTMSTVGPALVHVTGAVARPGLVEVPEGARVAEALAAAGGAAVDADLARLNLARLLTDGEQLVVPRLGEDLPAPTTGDVDDGDGRIDLNRATAEHLEELPGIGPVLAARIVSWRDDEGPFSSPGDLRQVPGIGERTFQSLADLVVVR